MALPNIFVNEMQQGIDVRTSKIIVLDKKGKVNLSKINTVMTATAIRQKLYDYIRIAEDRKVKAIYTMLEDEIEEVYNYWNDKDFVAELDKRSAEYKSGKVKGVAWDEAKAQILNSVKQKRK